MAEVRDKMGLSDPAKDDDVLTPPVSRTSAPLPPPSEPESVALNATGPRVVSPVNQVTDRLAGDTEEDMRAMLATVSVMMQRASSMGELREMIVSAYPTLDADGLVDKLSGGLLAARAAGISDAEAQSG